MMIMALTFSCLLTSAWAELFVAGNGRGDDAAAGTAEVPLATVKAALAKAEAGSERKIVLLPGVHFAPEGLFIGEKLSGLTIVAQQPGTATLVGGVEIKDWKQDGADWTAEVKLPPLTAAGHWVRYGAGGTKRRWMAGETTALTAAEFLLENGRRFTTARFPNAGYLYVGSKEAAKVGDAPGTAYIPKDGKIPAFSPAGTRLYGWVNDWTPLHAQVAEFDEARQQITLTGHGHNEMKPNRWFYLYGADAFIDQPGEMTLREGIVRLRPFGKDLGTIWAVTAPALVHIHAAKDVRLEGLVLSGSVNHVVQVDGGASHATIRHCLVEDAAMDGVFVGGDDYTGPKAHNVTVNGCLIRDNGRAGVNFWNTPARNADVCYSNVVENCRIIRCQEGVNIKHASRNRVERNEISNMQRSAVAIGSIRFHALWALGPGVYPEGFSWDTRYDYLHSHDNVVAHNHIHHVCLDASDFGAVYGWGTGRNNVVDGNWIHHVGNRAHKDVSGIYLDDASDYFSITRNIVHDVSGQHSWPVFAKGIGNRFEQNVLVTAVENDGAVLTRAMFDEPCEDHVYTRNVFAFDPSTVEARGTFGRWNKVAKTIGKAGATLTWDHLEVPADGEYGVFLRYTTDQPQSLDGRVNLSANGGPALPLANLPSPGGWGKMVFSSKPSAMFRLTKGRHTLVLKLVEPTGMAIDALVLSADPAFAPQAGDAPGAITIQAESALEELALKPRNIQLFADYGKSKQRIAESDHNLFFSADGSLATEGGPASGLFELWLKFENGRFDAHSLIADPGFIDLAKRDFRLQPDSPAHKLGIVPLDVTKTGVTKEFPKWLETSR